MRFPCALMLLSVALFMAPKISKAQYTGYQRQYVGIPSITFTPAAQQQDEWCWAASIQMILNYYQIPVTQPMIVARVKGALIDQGGSDADISNSLNGWAPCLNGSVRIVRSVTIGGAPAPQILLSELGQRHPILLTLATGPFSGHAVVVTGASYVATPTGPLVLSLIIRDPWPSAMTVPTQGRVEISGPQLASFIQAARSYWLVSVSSTTPSESSDENSGDESTSDSDECEELADYVKSAVHNFRSLRGEMTDNDSDSTTYRATHGIPGFTNCEINIYKEHDLQPSASCNLSDSDADLDDVWGKIKACFANSESSHKSLRSGEEY